MKTLFRNHQNRGTSQPNPAASSRSPRSIRGGQGAKGQRSIRRGGEEGFVLMVSLILLVLFTWLGLNGLTASTMETKISGSLADNIKAFYIAEAGLERAKSVLRGANFDDILDGPDNQKNNGNAQDPTNNDNGILSFGSSVSYAGGTYQVRITDNSDDSTPWSDSDRKVVINSTGTDSQGNTRTLRAEVWGRTLTFNAAISIYNDRAEKRFESTAASFVITGMDTTYTVGGPIDGPGPDVRGIVSKDGNPSDIRCDSASACYKVTGWNGIATVNTDYHTTNLGSVTLADLQAMRTDLIAKADIKYTGGTTLSSDTLGTASAPKIIHANDTLKLQGTVSGAGILVVDGNLEVEGNFTWQGIILISMYPGGSGRFQTKSGSTPKIYGAIAINSTSLCNEVETDGNTSIYYSSAALNLANQRTFRMLSWKEELD